MTAPSGDRRASELLNWRNWPLLVKLIAVLLVPTVFALALGVLRVLDDTRRASSYELVQQAVMLQDRTAGVLAGVQRERDLSVGFLAAGRGGDARELQRQFAAVDGAAAALRDAAGRLSGLDLTTVAAYRRGSEALSQLPRLRRQVADGDVDGPAAVRDYTQVTDALLTFDQSLAWEAADAGVAGLAAGMHALAVMREQVAQQHAIIANAIARGRMGAGEVEAVRAADVRLQTALGEFREAVSPQAYTATAGGADADTRDQLKSVAVNRGAADEPLLISAPEWDRVSTVVADELGKVQQGLRDQLGDTVAALQDRARNAAGVATVILLLGLLASVVVVVYMARSMLRPLRMLRRTALDVAERRLPAVVRGIQAGEVPDVAVEPVPVTTREEIGQVARAFDAVHGQAVRLAAEQAALRSTFNSIFVNLSRRSQALVERQLRLIEQLEREEEDPDALADLFQLDHLATRMRRNSENLLVLSGTELARRTSRPVPLVDVLRAAVSEVEQYQRVTVAPPPSVLVLGATAGDLVHLVAELLENAAQFSAPETEVSVASRQDSDGAVVVEISDRGVGMSEADLAEANARLAAPPLVDVSTSRRMGLFVVGRLASRHDIRVRLVGAPDAGVAAVVTVPASAVLPDPGGAALPERPSRSMASSLPLRMPTPVTNGSGVSAALAGSSRRPPAPPPAGEVAPSPAVAIAPAPEPAVDQAVEPAGRSGKPAGRSGEPAAPQQAEVPGAAASIPPASGSSAADLFTPVVAPVPRLPNSGGLPITRRALPESLPFGRPPLEENTPIFDGLASAWFRELKPVPVPWNGGAGPARDATAPGTDVPELDVTGPEGAAAKGAAAKGAVADGPDGANATETTGPFAPGQRIRPSPRPRSAPTAASRSHPGEPAIEPAAATPASSAEFSTPADVGWQAAAKAAATPEGTGTTPAGLPRRRPRAHLVPGAAGSPRVTPRAAPARSADAVRGRWGSYQQGVLEGREQRRTPARAATEPDRGDETAGTRADDIRAAEENQ